MSYPSSLPLSYHLFISLVEQYTRGPAGESNSNQARDKRLHDNEKRAANGRIKGNNLRVEIYDVFKLLLGDEFAN